VGKEPTISIERLNLPATPKVNALLSELLRAAGLPPEVKSCSRAEWKAGCARHFLSLVGRGERESQAAKAACDKFAALSAGENLSLVHLRRLVKTGVGGLLPTLATVERAKARLAALTLYFKLLRRMPERDAVVFAQREYHRRTGAWICEKTVRRYAARVRARGGIAKATIETFADAKSCPHPRARKAKHRRKNV
jgi:hypothetical protein